MASAVFREGRLTVRHQRKRNRRGYKIYARGRGRQAGSDVILYRRWKYINMYEYRKSGARGRNSLFRGKYLIDRKTVRKPRKHIACTSFSRNITGRTVLLISDRFVGKTSSTKLRRWRRNVKNDARGTDNFSRKERVHRVATT